METNIFLQQLSQRMDGDRRAMRKTLEILRSMIDRKLWKQMEQSVTVTKKRCLTTTPFSYFNTLNRING